MKRKKSSREEEEWSHINFSTHTQFPLSVSSNFFNKAGSSFFSVSSSDSTRPNVGRNDGVQWKRRRKTFMVQVHSFRGSSRVAWEKLCSLLGMM